MNSLIKNRHFDNNIKLIKLIKLTKLIKFTKLIKLTKLIKFKEKLSNTWDYRSVLNNTSLFVLLIFGRFSSSQHFPPTFAAK